MAGGTASGKTTVCDMIIQQLHDHRVILVNQVTIQIGYCYSVEELCITRLYVKLVGVLDGLYAMEQVSGKKYVVVMLTGGSVGVRRIPSIKA